MSDSDLPINRKTLDNIAALLGKLTENYGGDSQQLEHNLRQPLALSGLKEAMAPLINGTSLSAFVTDAQKNRHHLFSIDVHAKTNENSDEITQIFLMFDFRPPGSSKSATFAVLGAGTDHAVTAFLGNCLNSAVDSENTVKPENIQTFLQETSDRFGEKLTELLQGVLLGLAQTIDPKNLGPEGRKMQAQMINELSDTEEIGDLPLRHEIIARVPQIFKYLASVYNIEEQELHDLFEPTLRESVKEGTTLSANNLQESALSHPALKDVTLGVGDIDENDSVNLIAARIPLRDDEGNVLDTLAIIFSPEGVAILLESKTLEIAATHEQSEPVFKARALAGIVRASKNLSAEQAGANKMLLVNTLRLLKESATGRSSKKLQEALMFLSSLS
mgnify:CR=1 FL=1